MRRALAILLAVAVTTTGAPSHAQWVRAWQAPGQPPNEGELAKMPVLEQVQLEQLLRVGLAGRQLRVRLSNEFSHDVLRLERVEIANLGPDCKRGNEDVWRLKFGRSATVQIAPRSFAVSQPVKLRVAASDCLVIKSIVRDRVAQPTVHRLARADTIIRSLDEKGRVDFTKKPRLHVMRYFISGVDIFADRPTGAIVAIGDSITDGAGSTANRDLRWPDNLQRRILAAKLAFTVANAGISGNRVLLDGTGPSLLTRFDRDALEAPGVRYVILLEGINDLGTAVRDARAPSASAVIDGYRELISRTRAKGIKIFGATLTPFKGSKYYSDAAERARQEINAWIRTPGNFDGSIDFDVVVRDPADPASLRPTYHDGDFIHPNDTGYQKMADAVDLSLFR